jgi:TP901 family phage tail tape measure protein
MADREIKVAIVGDSKGLNGALSSANADLEGFGSKIASFGKVAALGIAGAVVGAGALGVKATVDLQNALAPVGTLLGSNTDAFHEMSDAISGVISNSPQSPDEIGMAAYTALSAGITGTKNVTDALTASVQLASAGLGTTEQSVGLITSAMNSFKGEGLTADQAARTFFGTIASGKTTTSDLAQGFGSIAPLAASLGVKFGDMLAATAALTSTGQSASDSYTGLKGIFSNLLKPTADASKAAKQLGLDFSAAHLQNVGLPTFLQEIKEKAGGNTEVMSKLFGSVEGLNAALALTGPQADAFAANLTGIGAAGDNLAARASEANATIANRFATLRNKVTVALGQIGQKIAEWLIPIMETAVAWIEDHWGDITNVFAAVGSAIATAFSRVGDAFGVVRDVVATVIDDIIGGFQNPDAAVNFGGWEAVILRIGELFGKAFEWLIGTGVPAVVDAFNSVRSWFVDNWPAIQNVFQTVWAALQVGFEWLLDHKVVLVAAIAAISAAILGPFVTAIAAGVIAYQQLEGFRQVVDNIVTWVNSVLLPAIQSAWEWIQVNTAKLAAYVSERWEAISAAVTNVLTVLKISVGAALAPIIFIWTNAHDQIMQVVNIVWQNIQLVIGTAMRVIKDIIDVVIGLLSGDWGLAWDGIKDIPLAAFDYMKGVVQLGIDAIKAIIEGVLAILAALWSLAWEGIKAVLSAAWDAMIAALSTAIQTVLQFFQQLPGNILAALGDLAGLLVQSGLALIGGLASGIGAAWPGVAQWLAGLPGAILGTIGSLESTLVQAGKDLISGLLAGAVSAFLEAASWLGGLGEKCAAAVGDLSSKLYEKGRQLIGGFVSGILSRAADVANAIASIPGVGAINNVFGGSGGPDVTPVGHAAGALITRPEFATLGEGGRDEAVINGDQAVRLLWAMANGANGPSAAAPITINVNNPQGSAQEWSKAMMREATWAYRTKVAA